LPISAQGATRDSLQDALKSYQRRRFDTEEARIATFQKLLPQFEETPLDMPTIFMSGYQRRLELIDDVIGQVLEVQTDEKPHGTIKIKDPYAISGICESFSRLDKFIGSSVNTSCVHKGLRGRREQ
jgi:hypothetical protein